MYLRSHRQKEDAHEYAELRITLTGLGVYEENMELSEMRQILQALQMSESDIKSHFQEDEREFANVNDVKSSTLNHPHIQSAMDSPSSSPEPHFKLLTVQALVHHPMNWNSLDQNIVDQNNDDIDNSDNCGDETSHILRKRNFQTSLTTESKRLCLNSIERAPDSGVNLSNSTSTNPSPVWEALWEDGSFEMGAHSSTKCQSEISFAIEEFSALDLSDNISLLDEEKEH